MILDFFLVFCIIAVALLVACFVYGEMSASQKRKALQTKSHPRRHAARRALRQADAAGDPVVKSIYLQLALRNW